MASATTTGTAATPDSIWSNSYVPPENAYSYGSYEVGVKFTASVAGEVTGVRFYKQTWMGGYPPRRPSLVLDRDIAGHGHVHE